MPTSLYMSSLLAILTREHYNHVAGQQMDDSLQVLCMGCDNTVYINSSNTVWWELKQYYHLVSLELSSCFLFLADLHVLCN